MTHPKPDLPPLPEPTAYLVDLHEGSELCGIPHVPNWRVKTPGLYLTYTKTPVFTAEQMLAAVLMERERAAQIVMRAIIMNDWDQEQVVAAIRNQGKTHD